MTKEGVLAALLVGVMVLLAVSVCNNRGSASEYIEAAQTANDSIATLTGALVAVQDAAARTTALAVKSDTVLVNTVTSTTITIEVARGAAALADSSFTSGADSLRAMLDTAGVRILDRIVNDHAVGRLADATAFHALDVRLGETEASRILWRTSSLQKDSVITMMELRFEQTVLRGEELYQAYNAERRKGRKTKIVAVVVNAVTLCVTFCPRPG